LAINTAAALVVGSGPEAVCVQVNGVAHIVYKSEKEKILKKILSEVAKKRSRLVPIEELEPFNRKEDIVANSRVVFKVAPKEIFFFNLNCKRYPESQSRDYIKIIP
jgi:hypothetical protein